MSTWRPLIIGDLTVPKPMIQGGMGVGISLSPLVETVATEEGVGIISTAQIGFRGPNSKKNLLEANPRAIGGEFQKTREIAPKGIIGFSIMVTMKDHTLYVKETVRVRADIIISGIRLPIALPELVQEAKTKIASIISSAESVMAILKIRDKKYQVVPDLMMIERPLVGGYLGSFVGQLEEIGASSENRKETYRRADYDEEVGSILKIVKGYAERYGKKILMVTAGGIYNHGDVFHQMELGVDDVQVAARFVTTEEYDAPEAHEQAYIHVRQEDIVITKSPAGMSGRAIRSPFLNLVSKEKQPIEHCYQCLKKYDHKTIPYCITRALVNAMEDDMDRTLMLYKSNVYRAEKIEAVTDVLNDLLGDAR